MLKSLLSMFNKNNQKIKSYLKDVEKINSYEEELKILSDEDIQSKFKEIKNIIKSSTNKKLALEENIHIIFAIIRESSDRVLKMRHYDVQIIGGLCLYNGEIAEMKTGEGKTLMATLAAVSNALIDTVHLVTVNDYLAQRDNETMKPLYDFLDMSNGYINDTIDHMDRMEIYSKDIVYITNNELAFDYLRDNMAITLETVMQKNHTFVIVDEVDSVLIDEARNPLIISGMDDGEAEDYISANKAALQLVKGEEITLENGKDKEYTEDYIVSKKDHSAVLNDAGITKVEEIFGVDHLFEGNNPLIYQKITQALVAHNIKEKDVDYIVVDGKVKIIDESTGRINEGSRYNEGLHQAIEAKEGVEVQPDSKALLSITYQNFFKIYDKISGMTGTAQTEATEFWEIYGLDVVTIPTNLPLARIDHGDLIYMNENGKFKEIAKQVKELNETGQPVLLGTASIEKSEKLSKFLEDEGIKHEILNAKNHFKEAEIIEAAGTKGSVTVATNMAGRGVDIKVNDEVLALGGLYVIGTERHETRRIDNQLRGRSGRQGDVGTTQFYISIEDPLMKVFGGDTLPKLMKKLNFAEDEAIDSKMVTRAIEKSQSKIEEHHFEVRKSIVEDDNLMDKQRKLIFGIRNDFLKNDDIIESKVRDYKLFTLEHLIAKHTEHQKDEIVKEFNDMFSINIPIKVIEDLNSREVLDKLSDVLDKAMEMRIGKLDDNEIISLFRTFILENIDKHWLKHIENIDIKKSGKNHLKDPKEAFMKIVNDFFYQMVIDLKIDITKTLYNLVGKE